jgi:hypothetical protein
MRSQTEVGIIQVKFTNIILTSSMIGQNSWQKPFWISMFFNNVLPKCYTFFENTGISFTIKMRKLKKLCNPGALQSVISLNKSRNCSLIIAQSSWSIKNFTRMYLSTFKEEMKMRMNLLFSPLTTVGMKDCPKWKEWQKSLL